MLTSLAAHYQEHSSAYCTLQSPPSSVHMLAGLQQFGVPLTRAALLTSLLQNMSMRSSLHMELACLCCAHHHRRPIKHTALQQNFPLFLDAKLDASYFGQLASAVVPQLVSADSVSGPSLLQMQATMLLRSPSSWEAWPSWETWNLRAPRGTSQAR